MNVLQVAAGTVSSLLFMFGTLPMLHKAFRTRNLKSYSLGNLLLSNLGNLIHWLYVSSLPFGPIWFLHGFSSLTTALMLVWYARFEIGCTLSAVPHCLRKASPCFNPKLME